MTDNAQFGHHPDPSTDFCCEVEMLEGWVEDIKAERRSQWPFWGRLSRLLTFVRSPEFSTLDEIAMRAKPVAEGLERRLTSPVISADEVGASSAALTRLQVENAKLREALAQAGTWFNEYASSHADKGAAEKAQRNRDRVDFCFTAHRRALTSKGSEA